MMSFLLFLPFPHFPVLLHQASGSCCCATHERGFVRGGQQYLDLGNTATEGGAVSTTVIRPELETQV